MPQQHGDQYKVPFQHLLAEWDERACQKLIGNGQHLHLTMLVQLYLLACATPAPGDPEAPLVADGDDSDEVCVFLQCTVSVD